jgi:hypothetical protein
MGKISNEMGNLGIFYIKKSFNQLGAFNKYNYDI